MKEHPILFSAPMVRAILDGTKTQTRRVVKLPDDAREVNYWSPPSGRSQPGWADPGVNYWTARGNHIDPCPYGQPSDRLWVRETWAQPAALDPGPTVYRADYPACVPPEYENVPPANAIRWKPSIHMPRALSRILLDMTGVRVERLQDISEADAISEGIEPNWIGDLALGQNGFGGQGWVPDCGWRHYTNSIDGDPAYTAIESYRSLWESINGAGSWEMNPWVWVIEFRRIA